MTRWFYTSLISSLIVQFYIPQGSRKKSAAPAWPSTNSFQIKRAGSVLLSPFRTTGLCCKDVCSRLRIRPAGRVSKSSLWTTAAPNLLQSSFAALASLTRWWRSRNLTREFRPLEIWDSHFKGRRAAVVDADSRLQASRLAVLGTTIANAPQHNCFQLRLVGNCSNLVGRAEELRLITFQQRMLQPNGRNRYLNTTGFATRRTRANIEADAFDPAPLRAEDTLLLADLMQAGELPLFAPDAIVEHYIPPSLVGCFQKDIRSAYLEGRTNSIIASKGVRIRLTRPERLRFLISLWKTARRPSIGRSAWFVVVVRQALLRTISFLYRCLRVGAREHT